VKAADVNADGQINSIDFTWLKKYMLKAVEKFPEKQAIILTLLFSLNPVLPIRCFEKKMGPYGFWKQRQRTVGTSRSIGRK